AEGDPWPRRGVYIAQSRRGPGPGHCLSSPVSFDTPLRSGPRHCGQSEGPLGTAFGAAGEFAASDDDAWTENQMMSRAAGSASDGARKRLRFIANFPFFNKKLFTQ